MSLDYDEALRLSRPGPAFSNGTEGRAWMDNWCSRCLRDAPFRSGISPKGCPLIAVALVERIPAEWWDGPRDEKGYYSMADQFTCVEFRAPGSGGGEPKPKPEPTDMDGLFPRPERHRRMYVPVRAQDHARPVETLVVAGQVL